MHDLAAAVSALDWPRITAALHAGGCATTGPLLPPALCADLAAAYENAAVFRSRVVMARHGFGQGEYQYFKYPLPDPVQVLREALYSPLAAIAST